MTGSPAEKAGLQASDKPFDANGEQVMIGGDIAPLLSVIDSRVSHPDNVLKISRQIGRRTGALSGAPGGWR